MVRTRSTRRCSSRRTSNRRKKKTVSRSRSSSRSSRKRATSQKKRSRPKRTQSKKRVTTRSRSRSKSYQGIRVIVGKGRNKDMVQHATKYQQSVCRNQISNHYIRSVGAKASTSYITVYRGRNPIALLAFNTKKSFENKRSLYIILVCSAKNNGLSGMGSFLIKLAKYMGYLKGYDYITLSTANKDLYWFYEREGFACSVEKVRCSDDGLTISCDYNPRRLRSKALLTELPMCACVPKKWSNRDIANFEQFLETAGGIDALKKNIK